MNFFLHAGNRGFLALGGMPEVIAQYVQGKSLIECQRLLDDLIISLKSDFVKYKSRVPFLRISEVFDSVVQQNGGKFVFKDATSGSNHKQIKEALELLIMAGLVIPVTHTTANGIPLGAECNIKKRKMLIFDTGIFQRLHGLDLSEMLFTDDFEQVNKGSIAELFAGLELLKSASCYTPQSLWYWHREAQNSNADVDYVVQISGVIIPVEVKSGKKGSMQSLYLFLKEKNRNSGIRLSLENYGFYEQIRIYPLYAANKLAMGDGRSGI